MDCADVMEGDFSEDLEVGAISGAEVGLLRDPVCGVEDKATHFVCCPNEHTAVGAAVTLTVKGSEMGETLSSAESACKEKRKKSSSKKASKPPRPPRAPSLDAADQKLIKEIAELAMLKRARIERMKALKKEKNSRAASSSSSGSAFALVFTVLFILVILFQGCSPSTKLLVTQPEGSSEAAGLLDQGVISINYNPTLLASYENGPSYGTPRKFPSSTSRYWIPSSRLRSLTRYLLYFTFCSSTEQVNDGKLPHESNAVVW